MSKVYIITCKECKDEFLSDEPTKGIESCSCGAVRLRITEDKVDFRTSIDNADFTEL